MKKIAVLTSGGDAPGMNACVRSIVKICMFHNIDCIGILNGYQGLIDQTSIALGYDDVNNIIQRGGTVLGTARCDEFRTILGRNKAHKFLAQLEVAGLIVIGGDGSFNGAMRLSDEFNIPIIGIPATIDNDIYGTDHTIGFDTALNIVVDAVDRIRDTASSHKRIFFVEVMGRDSGFIALNSAIASGAENVLIPERVSDVKALVREIKEHNKGKRSSIIIVAEGDDAGDAMTIMQKVKPHLPGYELRCSVLGHIQRGGNPSAYDRIIATQMGAKAVEMLLAGESGKMIGMKGEELMIHMIEDGIQKKSIPNLKKLDLIERLRTRK